MDLVWHVDDCAERDWLRFLLGDVVDAEIVDPDLTYDGADAIHVVSTNLAPLRAMEPYFERRRRAARRLVLVHLSDEWFSGGYRAYRHFDAVIRTHRTHLAQAIGILTVPLGYPNATRTDAPVQPAAERRLAWSFVGEMKASRHEMAGAMRRVEPYALVDTAGMPEDERPPKADFDAMLADSSFAPCPMGNVMLETWRLYEALELGCIPLVERRATLDYYAGLFGTHPLPTFGSWRSAADASSALLADPDALDGLQRTVSAWWEGEKVRARDRVTAHVAGPSHRESLRRFARRPANRSPVLFEALRLAELLRHQSAASLGRRLLRPGAIVRRLRRDSFPGRGAPGG
jgi:hypothetical protein